MTTIGRPKKKDDLIGKVRQVAGILYVKSIEAINVVSKKSKVHVEMWIGEKRRGNKLAYYATKDVSTENHAQFMDSDASLYSSYNCFFAHSSRIGGEKILKVRVLKGMNFLGKANIDLNELPLDRSDQKIVHTLTASKKKKWEKLDVQGQLKLTVAFDADPCQILKNMGRKRAGHTATLMDDGTVFICGGVDGKDSDPTNSVEIFDTTTYGFQKTMKFMTSNRAYHTANLLKDGRLLLCGGYSEYSADRLGYDKVEVYNLKTGYFEKVSQLKNGRYRHSSVVLEDGNVLVVGGLLGETVLSSCEIYNVKTDKWKEIDDVPQAMFNPSLNLLSNGDVLLCGGCAGKSVTDAQESTYIYYTKLGTWGPGPILPNGNVRHSVVPFGRSGIHIITSGTDWYTCFSANKNAKYFTPASIIDAAGKKLVPFGRTRNAAGLVFTIQDEFVISLGGESQRKGPNVECCACDAAKHLLDTEKYDQQWDRIDDLKLVRYEPVGVLLKNGTQILITGGIDANDRQDCNKNVELYDFGGTAMYKEKMGMRVRAKPGDDFDKIMAEEKAKLTGSMKKGRSQRIQERKLEKKKEKAEKKAVKEDKKSSGKGDKGDKEKKKKKK